MATVLDNKTTRLSIRAEVGVDDDGKAKYSERSISSVNPSITNDDALEVITAFGELQKYPVGSYKRTDAGTLVEE